MSRIIAALLVCCAAAAGAGEVSPPASAQPFTIVCFGDSITGDRPGVPYRQLYKWCEVLGVMIEASRAAAGKPGPVWVLNAGFAGDRTFTAGDRPGAIHRFAQQAIEPKPDVLVLLIGGNDASIEGRRDETAANLKAMAEGK